MLTDAQRKFIELEKQKEHVKIFFEQLQEATEAVVREIGINGFFQDPSDGTVFKLVVPEGRFVKFEQVGYQRTRRSHEKRGDLSLTEAREKGFNVE